MAWEWAYSDDVYGYVEEQLHKFSRDTLLEIAEEWRTKLNDGAMEEHACIEEDMENGGVLPPFVAPCTLDFSGQIEGMPVFSDSMLADWIWAQASSYEHGRTCTNGGHELYVCPDGCHTVDLGDMPDDWSPEEY